MFIAAHREVMDNGNNNINDNGSKSVAGGFFFAVCILIGFFVGAFNGQTAMGAIAGFFTGAVIAIGIWIIDSKKQQR